MATSSIHNILAVNLATLTDVTAAADRTYTATRALRVFDVTARPTAAPEAAAAVYTVANGAGVIFTMTTQNPAVINTVYRAGGDDGAGARAVTTCNDANMLVAAAGTIVFDVAQATVSTMTAYCITE